jgi:alpha-amylase
MMKRPRLFILFLLLWSFAVAQAERDPARAVYYEIFVRSFQDTTGDSIGDLQGVIERLDYLQDLGITGLWLMPIHPSPSYHGYDVTDYYGIHPDYGTLEDFRRLLDEAHARGISVIIDLVVNHTSSQHPWFLASRRGDAPYRDYYLWADENPGWRQPWGGPAWHRYGNGYYYGLFWSEMPDLNYRNPEVMREMQDVTRYWLELGVDGFRVDAIQHIVESEEGVVRNAPENFAWVQEFMAFVNSVNPEAFVVGETWTDTETIVAYHRVGLDMSFNYPLFLTLMDVISRRNPTDLAFQITQDEALYPEDALRGTFISNHDQIRPATQLGGLRPDERRLKLAAGLLLTLPGTPFLYYGEEIGMPNGPGERDEEKRTPMRWTTEPNAGFTTARPWHPFSTTDVALTVEAQTAEPDSLLTWYRDLIALRHANPALSQGDLQVLDSGNRSVLAFSREHDGQRVLVLANFTAQAKEIDIAGIAPMGNLTDLLSDRPVEDLSTLEPLEVRIFTWNP